MRLDKNNVKLDTLNFLKDLDLRPLQLVSNSNFYALGLALGRGNQGLEVVFTSSQNAPSKPNIRSAWKERKAGRATPLLFVAFSGRQSILNSCLYFLIFVSNSIFSSCEKTRKGSSTIKKKGINFTNVLIRVNK